MKNYIKFFAAIGVATAVAFSCTAVPEDDSHVAEVVNAPAVTISVSAVGDNSADVTIAPEGAASYYAYLVDDSGELEELDAETLYSQGYESVAGGLVKYDAETPSTTVSLTKLEPNTKYYVYAVAGSTTGVVGEIAVKSFTTSDNVAPELVDFDFEDGVVFLEFSEEVSLVEGKKVTAVVYAGLYRGATDTPLKTDAEGSIVSSEDGVVTISFEDDVNIPGTWYLVNYEEGTFADLAGNVAEALESSWVYNAEGAVSNVKGVYGRIKAGTIEVEVEEIPVITNYSDYITITSKTMLNKAFPKMVGVKVVHSEGGVTTTKETTLSGAPYYGATGYYTFGVRLEEEPARGDEVTITIKAQAFQDIYGSYNEEIVIGPLVYSYGYKLEDIYGEYVNDGTSAYGAARNEDPWSFVLAASDDEEEGNVMITSWYGFGTDVKIYGDFDTDLGTFEFPIRYQSIGAMYADAEMTQIAFFYTLAYGVTAAAPHITLAMTELGKFTTGTTYPGYYYEVYNIPEGGISEIDDDEDYVGGGYNFFLPVFTKAEETEATGSVPAKARVDISFPGVFRGEPIAKL